MRINVYAEELPELIDGKAPASDVQMVSTVADTGKRFFGARLLLKSHPDIHHTPTDDDRSSPHPTQ